MNVLVVGQYFYPEQFRINDICQQMVEDGHRVTVLTGIPNYPTGKYFDGYGVFEKRYEIHKGIEIIRTPIIPRGDNKIQLGLNYFSFVLSGWVKAMGLVKREFDVVFVYETSPITMALPAISIAKKKKIPLVMYVMDLWPESVQAAGGTNNSFALRMIGKVADYIYHSCDRILVSSKSFTTAIANRGHGTEKIEFWPQYAEDLYSELQSEADELVRADIPDGFNIVFTGNIGQAQGLDVVVHAAERLRDLPDIRWVLIGDGRAKTDLEKLVTEKGLEDKVRFVPRKPVELMPSYLSLADAALLPLKDDPVFSMILPAKLQSYMACGVPILACANGEASDTIQEANAGLTCKAGDFEGLAIIVRQLYEMKDLERKQLGKNAARFFKENYTKQKLMKRFYTVLSNHLT